MPHFPSLTNYHQVDPVQAKPARRSIAPGQLLINGRWRDASDGATMYLVTGPCSVIGDSAGEASLGGQNCFHRLHERWSKPDQEWAATMKHMTMELGGKSPNIIFADAK